jgi:serine/threonine-protein kinase RsbW
MGRTGNVGLATNRLGAAPFVELHQCAASRTTQIPLLVDRLVRFIRLFMERLGMAKGTEEVIEIAIWEAIANAMIHGNRENTGKTVDVTCRCSMDGEVLIIIRDQGTGFDSGPVPDPTEPERPCLSSGRGLHIMRALMDEVLFEENGTVVRMRKRVKISAV